MEKTFDGYEGDTTSVFRSSKSEIVFGLYSMYGYKKEVNIKPDNTAILTYENPFLNDETTKAITSPSKYSFKKLSSFKPTDLSIHKILKEFFDYAEIETVDD